MFCISCARPASGICESCAGSLARAPRRLVSRKGITVDVQPVFVHRGAAVRLVHHLKYRRSIPAARFLANLMARLVPPDATALVPVPRVLTRRALYGVDQTAVLAETIGQSVSLPVVRALSAGVWAPRSAGRQRSSRVPGSFRRAAEARPRPVLVDDVCTTGETLCAAASALGYDRIPALVVTAAGSMEVRIDDFRNGEVA